MASRRAVITSISPTLVRTVQGNAGAGPAYQAHCIRSWRDAGFDVVSLNADDELAVLEPRHPDVRFVRATRTGRDQWGAPLVYIADLVATLDALGYAVGGIVNADVFTLRDRGYFDRVMALCSQRGAAFGMRVDVSDLASDANAGFYAYGYDYFFFEVATARAIAPTEHLLGMTWWDLWFPMALHWSGLGLHRLMSPTVFHLTHPERTGGRFDTLWRHFYRHTVDCVAGALARGGDPLLETLFAPSRGFRHAEGWEDEAVAFGEMSQQYLERAAQPQALE
jgi:hypothetical protein